jgi:vacuolar-type H+-ATPase subunit I/STV1
MWCGVRNSATLHHIHTIHHPAWPRAPHGADMTPDYKNKSQTMFGVAIICLGFVLETMQLVKGHPNAATAAILSLLFAVFIGTTVLGVVWHRRYKALAKDQLLASHRAAE